MSLRLEKVHVLAISAGGMSGITFAARYPKHAASLTLQSAVSKQWLTPKDAQYKAGRILFHPRMEAFTWGLVRLMLRLMPKAVFKQMTPSFSTLPFKEIEKYMQETDLDEFCAMCNRQRSGSGFMIDLEQARYFDTSVLKGVQCPTLIMHSKQDHSVSFEHAIYAREHINGAELVELETWGHLIWIGKGSEKVAPAVSNFLTDETRDG